MKSPLYFCLWLLCLTSFSASRAQSYCNYNQHLGIDHNVGDDTPMHMLVQSDGKVIIAGTTYNISGNVYRINLARLDEDLLSVDTTFASQGKIHYTWEGRNTCIAASLQSDDKILLGGYQAPGNGLSTFRPYVARMNSDGSVDETWGEEGSVKFGSASTNSGRGSVVEVQEMLDGKVRALFTGSHSTRIGVAQFNSDGTFDDTFGEGGMVSHYISGMSWQPSYGDGIFLDDGSMFVICKAYSGFTKPCIIKMNADGSLDTGFGEEGILILEYEILYNWAGIYAETHLDQDILVACTHNAGTDRHFAVMKIDSETGQLDSDFGANGDGIAQSLVSDEFTVANYLVMGEDDQITVLGTAGSLSNNATWTIDGDGMEIMNCSSDNGYYEPIEQYQNGYYAGVYNADGELLVVSRGPVEDENSEAGQGQNIIVPHEVSLVSVNEFQSQNFQVYPNPSDNLVHIQGKLEIDRLILLNGQGKQVLSTDGKTKKLDVSQLPAGCYFLRLISGQKMHSERLIIQ
ncbi:MAG: T9SS type A sorting domain-containing protein [Flavobacteriales bacterium]|nr:T9SS type A sorting domain-containing protein [Flavobacteriales bacterium]